MNPAQRAGAFFGVLGLFMGVVVGEEVRHVVPGLALIFGILVTSFFIVAAMLVEKTPSKKEPEQP